jgi:RNA polymerase sigma factor (sigma-70 family)
VKLEQNEQALLQGLANNDAKCVEIIYTQNFNTIYAMIANNNGSYDDAKDIFQEAMIALYEKAKMESFVLTCKINTYVYSICRRLWLKRLQQIGKTVQQNENFEETVWVEEDLDVQKRRNEEFEIMERALSNMGEPCKSLLEGYYLKKLDMQQLASQFGYTNADNAKNQKYKCLMRLKKMFFAKYNIGE